MTEFSRRALLKTGVAAAGVSLFNINHAWSQDVTWDGQPFDARGATLRIGNWGGIWADTQRKLLLDQFEKDYNCKVQYDSTWPWFPKFVANGPKSPALDLTNWNIPEMTKTARAGDFFLPVEELVATLPNASNLWDFSTRTGIGITWAFSRYCYVYRTDTGTPVPTEFKDFWKEEFAGKRGTYITSNTLQMAFLMASAQNFGSGETDWEAGFEAMKEAMPMKISDFTGNMTTLVERGEVTIAVQNDAEAWLQAEKGIPVGTMLWENPKTVLTQTQTVSRYAEPTQKKLAFALLNGFLAADYQTAFANEFWMRPTNKDAVIPEKLAKFGAVNSADATADLHIPDWNAYLENEDDIVEIVNGIFSS